MKATSTFSQFVIKAEGWCLEIVYQSVRVELSLSGLRSVKTDGCLNTECCFFHFSNQQEQLWSSCLAPTISLGCETS